MSTREKARQTLAEQRLQERHLNQSVLGRSESEIGEEADESDDSQIQEETRELLAKQRQKDQHRMLSLKHRSEEEVETVD